MTAPVLFGWKVLADYAEPVGSGGYVEIQADGEITVAYETDQSAREMGVDAFLLTRVPLEVMRALVAQYDASQSREPSRLVAESELAHMREGCRLLRAIRQALGVELSDADYAAYHAWLDADDPDATEARERGERAA